MQTPNEHYDLANRMVLSQTLYMMTALRYGKLHRMKMVDAETPQPLSNEELRNEIGKTASESKRRRTALQEAAMLSVSVRISD